MSKGCLTRLVVVVFFVGLVAVVGVGVYAYLHLPALADQVPPPGGGVLLTLVQPVNGSELAVGQTVPVSAESTGSANIQAADLWVDGQDVGPGTPSSGAEPFSTYWSWTPAQAGEHTLSIHASLSNGSAVTSNLVRVSASQPAGSTPAAAPGSSGTPPTPTPAPAGGSAAAGSPAAGGGQAPAPPPSGPGFWVQSHLPGAVGTSKPPAAPSLAAQVNGCDIQLTLTDQSNNESGFLIYRSDPASVDYSKEYQWGPENGSGTSVSQLDKGLYGTVSYYATAFNPAGSSDSNPVTVNVNNVNCLTVQWSGLSLVNGKIQTSTPVDKLYCYSSTSKGVWTRFPLTIGKFIPKDQGGGFDVSNVINHLVTIGSHQLPVDVQLQCWGWAGGQLNFLGSGQQSFDPSNTGNLHITGTKFDFTSSLQVKPLDGQPQGPQIVFPYDVQRASDPSICTQHAGIAGGLICQSAIKDRYAAIVWKLTDLCGLGVTNCITASQVDGYHVYELQSSGQPALIKTINDPKKTLALIPPPGWPGLKGTQHCIMVRAFAGMLESVDSNVTCYTYDDLGAATINLKPAALSGRIVHKEKCGFTAATGVPNFSDQTSAGDTVIVGDYHSHFNCDYENGNYRGAVWFDMSKIPGTIIDAQLTYQWKSGLYQPSKSVATNQIESCATNLMLGSEDWRGKDYGDKPVTIPAKDYMPISTGPITSFALDVTPIVKSWRSGAAPNYGFVMRGPEPSLTANIPTSSCVTLYDNFRLAVTYYKP